MAVPDKNLIKRQGLDGVLTGILGPTPTNSDTDPIGIGGITSIIHGVPSVITSLLPVPLPTGSSSSIVSSSSRTTSSQTSQIPSTSSTPILSLVSSTSASSLTPSPTPSSPPSSSPPTSPSATPPPVVSTNAEGGVVTIISTASLAATSETLAAAPKSFLDNKPLEGGVFALVGIIALILIISIATYALRKSRRNRLDREFDQALSFDPGSTTGGSNHHGNDDVEKGARRYSSSSSGHGHGARYAKSAPLPPLPVAQANIQRSATNAYGYGHAQTGYYQPSFTPTLYIPNNSVRPPPVAIPTGSARRTSPLNSPPPSSPSSHSSHGVSRHRSSHSRELDRDMSKMPVAPPLPATFGAESADDIRFVLPMNLKIANE